MIHEATRTLVKSQPEVWEQCSDPESLSRHLNGSFGEIRITRLEPESTVAWEGEHGSGTVTIEPSAWGTRVTLTAERESEPDEVSPDADPPGESEPVAAPAQEEPEAASSEDEPEPEPPEPVTPESLAPEHATPEPVAPEAAPSAARDRLSRLFQRMWRGRAIPDPVPEVAEPAIDVAETEPMPPEPPLAAQTPEPEPEPPEPEPEQPEPEPEPADDRPDGHAILMAALESMGQAHHRPFSRG